MQRTGPSVQTSICFFLSEYSCPKVIVHLTSEKSSVDLNVTYNVVNVESSSDIHGQKVFHDNLTLMKSNEKY